MFRISIGRPSRENAAALGVVIAVSPGSSRATATAAPSRLARAVHVPFSAWHLIDSKASNDARRIRPGHAGLNCFVI